MAERFFHLMHWLFYRLRWLIGHGPYRWANRCYWRAYVRRLSMQDGGV